MIQNQLMISTSKIFHLLLALGYQKNRTPDFTTSFSS